LAAVFPLSDRISHEVLSKAFGSGWFKPARTTSTRDPSEWIRADQADVVLVAPPEGITQALQRGNARIQLLIDAKNVVRAQQIEGYLTAILQTTALDFIPVAAAPQGGVVFETRVLYNPELITSYFMVPGVMSMILCVITVIMTSMAIAREREVGTFEMLIAAPISIREILLGKTVPYIALGMLDAPVIILFATAVFGVPLRGSLLLLLLLTFVFVCTTVAVGTLISTISKTQQQAMLGGFIFLLPAVLFSGLMFPVENMPIYMRVFGYCNPLYYYNSAVRNIMLKGGDPSAVLVNVLILAAFAAGLIWISAKRFRLTLG